MADEPDDSALLRDYILGDSQAFTVLVRRHQTWMWMNARAMLGNGDDAMDAVQQALIRAFRSAHTWRQDGPVVAWLNRILARVMVDVYAARAKAPTPVETEDNPNFPEMTAPDNSELALAERLLHEVIAGLPKDQRECFARIDVLGFTYAEVAAELGIPEGTVKSRRSRGKDRVREALGKPGLVGPTPPSRTHQPDTDTDTDTDDGTSNPDPE